METIELSTPSASCGGCQTKIADTFKDVQGVESAVLDLETKHTTVVYDSRVITVDTITQTLTDAGYAPAP